MENKELTIFEGNTKNMYCSKKIENEEDKKQMFNALEKCDIKLNDIVGEIITIKDIYIEENEIIDKETGEIKNKYRTILFDENGKTYVTGAYGIYNVLKKLVNIYGTPEFWGENGIKVKVIKKDIGNGRQSLTLQLI